MRTTILFLLTLFACVLGAHAQPQNWNYQGDNQSGTEQVVYVGLVDSKGNALSLNQRTDWLGAFIDGECRGAVTGLYQSDNNGSIFYFSMRIKGSASDYGKSVSFRLYRQSGNDYSEYNLTAKTPLTYSNDGDAVGTLSNLFTLVFEQPRYFTFPQNIEVNVDGTLDLMEQFTWEPSNATRPINLTWDFSNSSSYINVENNILKGIRPTNGTYLGFRGLGDIKSMNGNSSTTVKVVKPITDLKLKDEYLKGDSVYIGDSAALGNILRNCYEITPIDANETLTWSWNDQAAIQHSVDENGVEHWEPIKAGVYQLTLKGGNHSVSMPLTILNHIEDFTAVVKSIDLFVDDNLTDLLPYAVKFEPSEYVKTNIVCSVENPYEPTPVEVLRNYRGVITAITPGQAKVHINAEDYPGKEIEIIVNVHPNVTSVKPKKTTLSYEYQEGEQDITDDLLNNLIFNPDETHQAEITYMWSNNDSVCEKKYSSTKQKYIFTASGIGTTTISYQQAFPRTTLSDDNTLVTNTLNFKTSFTLNVVQGLMGFTFEDVKMSRNEVYELVLTPNPTTAQVDVDDINVQITTDELPQGWTLATSQDKDATKMTWTITPKAIGKGQIVVYYKQARMTTKNITIGQDFTQKEGWKWVTPYGGNASISSIYGDDIQEMRSQDDLMYNDPKCGYFGTLTGMSRGVCYKVRIKDGQSVNTFNENVDYYSGGDEFVLGQKWSWLGFPYQFDHAISDIFAQSDFTEGDRIVSKDNGFAEYDGTQWTGTLTTINAGEGYLIYNSSDGSQEKLIEPVPEYDLGQPSMASGAKIDRMHNEVWTYNSAHHADNMTIVADLGPTFASNRYTIGAFVADECRGEGSFVNGKWFITVHGNIGAQGQKVSFRVYDTMTGIIYNVENQQQFAMLAGSLRAPLRMTVGLPTGIDSIGSDAVTSNAQLYTIDGKRVSGQPAPGVYIVKDGTTMRKVVVK